MSRESILSRIQEALKTSTDDHVRQVVQKTPTQLPVLSNHPDGSIQAVKEFLPRVGPSFEDHKLAFRTLSEKLQTEFVCVQDIDAARSTLKELAEQHGWKKAGVHNAPLVMETVTGVPFEFLDTSSPYEVRDLEICDVGISGCDALIAQTASILITTQSAGGRSLSVLPPHHVVIATREQMVTTMVDGYALLREKLQGEWPSFISFITGPSRTADIERVLVLGAHGPKKLTVILIEQ